MTYKITLLSLACCLAATMATAEASNSIPSRATQEAPILFSLVQRNCAPDNIVIDKNTPKTTTTACMWKLAQPGATKADADMQVSLKIADDVDQVGLRCTFTPQIAADGTHDFIASVSGSKAAMPGDSAKPTELPAGSWFKQVTNPLTGQMEVIALIINNKISPTGGKNFYQDFYQANVIFDLNVRRSERWVWTPEVKFHEQNKITCTFAPNAIPDAV